MNFEKLRDELRHKLSLYKLRPGMPTARGVVTIAAQLLPHLDELIKTYRNHVKELDTAIFMFQAECKQSDRLEAEVLRLTAELKKAEAALLEAREGS